MKKNFLVVNGILTNPLDINGWTDLFEDFYQNKGYPCTKYEYFSGAITRFMYQGKRVEEIVKVIKRIESPLVYVGHSNGCELFDRIIKETDIKFQSAHLIAGAMEFDFTKNGLNSALFKERVGKIYLYCSKGDKVLKNWASKTSFLNFVGLGYGTLGYTGPVNILKGLESKVDVTWKNKYNHSDWFSDKNIDKTFELTLRK